MEYVERNFSKFVRRNERKIHVGGGQ